MSAEIQKAGLVSVSIEEAVDLAQSDSDLEEEVGDEIKKIITSVTADVKQGMLHLFGVVHLHFLPVVFIGSGPRETYVDSYPGGGQRGRAVQRPRGIGSALPDAEVVISVSGKLVSA